MKKNTTIFCALMTLLLTACGETSSQVSSSVPSSPVSVASSSSEGPKVKEAPTIDKVAAVLDNLLEKGLSEYTYSYRNISRNTNDGSYFSNIYKTIDAKQYSNGVDAIQTIYSLEGDELTSSNVSVTGPLKAYKVDDDYYTYGFVSNLAGQAKDYDSFVEILERNRYNDETTMEFFSNGLINISNEFNGNSGWNEIYGYVHTPFTATLEDDKYYCEIGATAEEDERYGAENNYAWAVFDAYTLELEEIGIHMQSYIRSDKPMAGKIGSLTEVTLKNMVSSDLVEGEIAPLDYSSLPTSKITDYRTQTIEVADGDISSEDVLKIVKNLRGYTKGTNYSHRDFSEAVYGPIDEEGNYGITHYIDGYADATCVIDQSLALNTYKDSDNDPSTPFELASAVVNVAGDEGIVNTSFMPEYNMSYSSIVDPEYIYSMNDYLNPNGFFIGYYGIIMSEVASKGWGEHDDYGQIVTYVLKTATCENGVINIEFDFEFDATEWSDASTTSYKFQITDGFLNMIGRKEGGAPKFDVWYNYKLESPY